MHVKFSNPIRWLALAALCVSPAIAQLPATHPTGDPLPVAVPASQLTTAERVKHRADVTYRNGQLEITADDSSLNQILRAIARETGMKITGGVTDERVFGKYGPAPPGQVLASLLDGTGSNMLLIENSKDTPAELILTSRQGGPTPPNPNASRDEDDQPPPVQQTSVPVPAPASPPTVQATQPPNQTPPASGFVSAPTVDPQTEPGTTPGPTTQATGTSDPVTPQSPNGVKTPQQIYLELQQLRQQQQQQQQPASQ